MKQTLKHTFIFQRYENRKLLMWVFHHLGKWDDLKNRQGLQNKSPVSVLWYKNVLFIFSFALSAMGHVTPRFPVAFASDAITGLDMLTHSSLISLSVWFRGSPCWSSADMQLFYFLVQVCTNRWPRQKTPFALDNCTFDIARAKRLCNCPRHY